MLILILNFMFISVLVGGIIDIVNYINIIATLIIKIIHYVFIFCLLFFIVMIINY